ncbi:hypothetical protein EBZ80_06985, partial [bacterium]|nr:hypothetical protein [bacterium]
MRISYGMQKANGMSEEGWLHYMRGESPVKWPTNNGSFLGLPTTGRPRGRLQAQGPWVGAGAV